MMAKMLDCGLEISEFEHQSHHYIHFYTFNKVNQTKSYIFNIYVYREFGIK